MKYTPILIFLGILSLSACKTIPIEDCTEVDEDFIAQKLWDDTSTIASVTAVLGVRPTLKCGFKPGDSICTTEERKILSKVRRQEGKIYWCNDLD